MRFNLTEWTMNQHWIVQILIIIFVMLFTIYVAYVWVTDDWKLLNLRITHER